MTKLEVLLRERHLLVEEMREIVEKGDKHDKFTRSQRERMDEIERDVAKFDERIAEEERAESEYRAKRAAASADDGGIALSPEQRMTDHYAARDGLGFAGNGLGFGLAGDGFGRSADPADFNLGRIAGALLGRLDRSELTDVETRALAEGVDSAGGFLIPEPLAPTVIDRIRAKAQVINAGARTVPMTADTLNIARLVGGSGANWKAENAAVTESDQVYDRVVLKTKTAVVLQRMSQELFEDLSGEAAAIIETELLQALALKLDAAALRGDPGVDPNSPRGIRNQPGVNIVSLGANGATPTSFSFLIDALSAVRDANGDVSNAAAIYSSRTQKTIDKFADTTGQPLRQPESVAAVRKLVSNQIGNALTQGTSNDASEAYVGDFSQVLMGLRNTVGMRVKILNERYADNLQVGLIAWLRADVALAHPEHLSVVTGIRP
jgi:HK97 family phage major capsid protein